MHNIALEDEIMITSVETICKLFSYPNGDDLVALYMFYYKQCKIQRTNQTWSTGAFVMKGLGWGDTKFTAAKRILKDLGLIEDIRVAGDDGKVQNWYIKMNYLRSTTSETTRVVLPGGGFQGTNAGSSIKINAGSSEKEIQIPIDSSSAVNSKESITDIDNSKSLLLEAKEKLFEDFWALYPRHINKKAAKAKFEIKAKQDGGELIINRLKSFVEKCKADKTEVQFIPHPSTWLNGERYNDEIEVIVHEPTPQEMIEYKETCQMVDRYNIISKYVPEAAAIFAKRKLATPEELVRFRILMREFEIKYNVEKFPGYWEWNDAEEAKAK